MTIEGGGGGGQVISRYKDFSYAPQSMVSFRGLNIPVGVETSSGAYYPIEKGSLQIGSDSVTLDLTPYLAYQGQSALTGTWRAWFSAGHQTSDSLDFSDYYNKFQIDTLISSLQSTDGIPIWQPITTVVDSIATLQPDRVPVALQTSKGTFYPIEKGSVQLQQDGTIALDLTPYLAYDGLAQFQGTWKVYYSGNTTRPYDKRLTVDVQSNSTVQLDHSLYNRWQLQGSNSKVAFTLTDWQNGDRGQVIVDTSKQSFLIPASWIVPDKVWDAWTEAPGVYCMLVRKQGGVIYAHAQLPFAAPGGSQDVPVNLSSRLQAIESVIGDFSDSLSSLDTRITSLQTTVSQLSSAWTTLQWSATISLDPSLGPKQKLTLQGATTLTSPTLSSTYQSLTLQIAKSSSYSFTNGGVTIQANQTTILSWYWDGETTRRLPLQFLGD